MIVPHCHCPKQLWLSHYRPELASPDPLAELKSAQNRRLAEVVRGLYPGGIVIEGADLTRALEDTDRAVWNTWRPIHQAAFAHQQVTVRADLLLPRTAGYTLVMLTPEDRVRRTQVEAAAVQAWVIGHADVTLDRIEIAHVNAGFRFTNRTDQRVFVGGGEAARCTGEGVYAGLLAHVDVTGAVRKRIARVPEWLRQAEAILAGDEPGARPGTHCDKHEPCPFRAYCRGAGTGYPVEDLKPASLARTLRKEGYADLRQVPKSRLTRPIHRRIRKAARSATPFLDPKAALRLAALPYPRYYLGIETAQSVVPSIVGTGPRTHLPFLWSCHIEEADGALRHVAFLARNGEDPRRDFTESLLHALGAAGPVLVYDRDFVHYRLLQLVTIMYDLYPLIEPLIPRLVDLGRIVRKHYYHRDMRGAWSLGAVLPTLPREPGRDGPEPVDADRARAVFAESIDPATSATRRRALRRDLLDQGERGTRALVGLTRFLQGAR